MANYILLCHGAPREYSSFEVPELSEVVYWGAPGYLLPADVAWTSIAQIRMNPTDLDSIGRSFKGLPPLEDRTLTGGKTYAPDLNLAGDDNLLCILINMNTNEYALLGNDWSSRLSAITAAMETDLLHLLCCTGSNPHPNMRVLDGLSVKDWRQVIPH